MHLNVSKIALRCFFYVIMEFEQLKQKAANLPMSPGVYIMKNADDQVIYVGKAKKLKNRVSQYFQDTAAHSLKTKMMVSNIHHFEVIVASSEFHALVLECSLIKRHQPKYNILLKDDKGYPYIRVDTTNSYPDITMVNKAMDDGAVYYGPFGSRSITQDIVKTVKRIFLLPTCNKKFPQDIGRGRPCLNYHLKQCAGWCQLADCRDAYLERINHARELLQGDFKGVTAALRQQMQRASDELNFELAATLRDSLSAIESLSKKSLVVAGKRIDTDVIGFAQSAAKACFVVMHYSNGELLDKDYEILSSTDDVAASLTSLVKQYYFNRAISPKIMMLPCGIEDSDLIEQLIFERHICKTKIRIPQRGNGKRLVELANQNALDEVQRSMASEERVSGALTLLAKMIGTDLPRRIESFDISNLSGTDIVAGMVVFLDGKPKRSEYKKFKIKGLDNQDDYASMAQVISRRFQHYLDGDKGFSELPDLLLIDGGANHAKTVQEALQALGFHLNILGMVKDNRHRTRALVTTDGEQIAIDGNSAVFSFIGAIQEETHRFAINYHRKLRSNRIHYSELDSIPGVGPKRKELLLKVFKSLKSIAEADLEALQWYLPADTAKAVYDHFRAKSER